MGEDRYWRWRRTDAGVVEGRERGPLAVLSEMWETEYVDEGGLSVPGIGVEEDQDL